LQLASSEEDVSFKRVVSIKDFIKRIEVKDFLSFLKIEE